jgi:hypothetical protein
MRSVEGIVRLLQQVGDHKRGVGDRHRHYSKRKPPRGCDARNQSSERHAAERRQRHRRTLPREPPAVGPRECEQGRDDEREGWPSLSSRPHKPAERKRREQGHAHKRDICEPLRTPLFSDSTNRHEPDHRDSGDQCPQGAAHPRKPPRGPGSRQPHNHTLAERQRPD